MRILVFDNYDSFTYNLVHLLQKNTLAGIDVFRNDEITIEEIAKYDKIVLSPGPGVPSGAGLLLPLINEYAKSKSILGVCLGHQAIGQAFGGTLLNLSTVFHGVATPLTIIKDDAPLLQGLPTNMQVGRYHSWVISPDAFPTDLEITGVDEHGHIMALQHKKFDVQGVQFHPESVLTPDGEIIIRNWLKS